MLPMRRALQQQAHCWLSRQASIDVRDESRPAERFLPHHASGWLQKSGKGLKAKVFEPRFCVLYAEPSLAFFADDSLQDAKGGPLLLGGATAKREGEFVLLNVPEEVQTSDKQRFQQTKVQADSEAEADLWVARVEAAVAGKPQPP